MQSSWCLYCKQTSLPFLSANQTAEWMSVQGWKVGYWHLVFTAQCYNCYNIRQVRYRIYKTLPKARLDRWLTLDLAYSTSRNRIYSTSDNEDWQVSHNIVLAGAQNREEDILSQIPDTDRRGMIDGNSKIGEYGWQLWFLGIGYMSSSLLCKFVQETFLRKSTLFIRSFTGTSGVDCPPGPPGAAHQTFYFILISFFLLLDSYLIFKPIARSRSIEKILINKSRS